MSVLNVLLPNIQPRASDYIPMMIELIKKLINFGHAYEKEGKVKFSEKHKAWTLPDYPDD